MADFSTLHPSFLTLLLRFYAHPFLQGNLRKSLTVLDHVLRTYLSDAGFLRRPLTAIHVATARTNFS